MWFTTKNESNRIKFLNVLRKKKNLIGYIKITKVKTDKTEVESQLDTITYMMKSIKETIKILGLNCIDSHTKIVLNDSLLPFVYPELKTNLDIDEYNTITINEYNQECQEVKQGL